MISPNYIFQRPGWEDCQPLSPADLSPVIHNVGFQLLWYLDPDLHLRWRMVLNSVTTFDLRHIPLSCTAPLSLQWHPVSLGLPESKSKKSFTLVRYKPVFHSEEGTHPLSPPAS